MDEEELLNLINSLPPSTQQAMVQYLMAGGDPSMGGTAPFGAGPMNTGRTAGEFQGGLGVSPFDSMAPGAAYAYTPELDKYGNEQPFDLTTAKSNLNYVQDVQGNLFNNAFMMQGGEGVYAPGTFDPLPQAPGDYERRLQSYLTDGPNTYRGFIAERVANGVPPEQALNEFWTVANDPENPASASLLASLPTKFAQVTDPVTGTPSMAPIEGGDKEAPQRLVYELADAQLTQTPQAPEFGAIAQDYIDKGIPFPTERYGQGQYSLDAMFPGRQENMGQMAEAQRNLEAARNAAQPEAVQRAQAEYLTGAREQRSAPLQRAVTGVPTEYPGGVPRTRVGDGSRGEMTGVPTEYPGAVPKTRVGDGSRGEMTGVPTEYPGAVPRTAILESSSEPGSEAPFTKWITAGEDKRATKGIKRQAKANVERAQREFELAQSSAHTPESRRMSTMNRAMNHLGRTPTQDTLMARQLVNYMMGAYGPRG